MPDKQAAEEAINLALRSIGSEKLVKYKIFDGEKASQIFWEVTDDRIGEEQKAEIFNAMAEAAKEHGYTVFNP